MAMQAHIDEPAQTIEGIAYDNDFGGMLDFFDDAAGFGYRENAKGEYESAHVLLTYGPTIELDTATGEIYCYFYSDTGEARLSKTSTKNVNEFFRELHDC